VNRCEGAILVAFSGILLRPQWKKIGSFLFFSVEDFDRIAQNWGIS
jgi:hypothetical protein